MLSQLIGVVTFARTNQANKSKYRSQNIQIKKDKLHVLCLQNIRVSRVFNSIHLFASYFPKLLWGIGNDIQKPILLSGTTVLKNGQQKTDDWCHQDPFGWLQDWVRLSWRLTLPTSLYLQYPTPANMGCDRERFFAWFIWRFAPAWFCNARSNGGGCYVTRCSGPRIFDQQQNLDTDAAPFAW